MHSLGSPEVSGGQGKSPKSWFASPEGCVWVRGWTPARPHVPRVHCDPGQMMSLSQVSISVKWEQYQYVRIVMASVWSYHAGKTVM